MAAFFGGAFFGGGFFGALDVGGGKRPWKQKWRQELVDLMAERREVPEVLEAPEPPPVPRRVRRAIERVLETVPEDDSAAVESLRAELKRLKVRFQPAYAEAIRIERLDLAIEAYRQRMLQEDEETILLMLH